jgi:hypothetical protein
MDINCWDKTRNKVLDYYIYPIGIRLILPTYKVAVVENQSVRLVDLKAGLYMIELSNV